MYIPFQLIYIQEKQDREAAKNFLGKVFRGVLTGQKVWDRIRGWLQRQNAAEYEISKAKFKEKCSDKPPSEHTAKPKSKATKKSPEEMASD
jgi:hypothetical protein